MRKLRAREVEVCLELQSLLQNWNPGQVTILSVSLWTGLEASRMARPPPPILITLAPLSCSLQAIHHQPGGMGGQLWCYFLNSDSSHNAVASWEVFWLLLSDTHQEHNSN